MRKGEFDEVFGCMSDSAGMIPDGKKETRDPAGSEGSLSGPLRLGRRVALPYVSQHRISRSPARQRVSQKPCGVSTVAPPVKLGQESACERKDRWSPIKCLGRTTLVPKSVCAEIPSRERSRYCPPCGTITRRVVCPQAARREERTASEPDLSEVFLLQFFRILAFSFAVKYLVLFFSVGFRLPS